MKPSTITLYSGASAGAEAAFGEAAERWDVPEINLTFAGHDDVRERGRTLLSAVELAHPDIQLADVERLMRRAYANTTAYRHLLASLWHQVDRSAEVFCVGWIRDDGTMKGGTGWAAELAKLGGKPLHVYDQAQRRWFAWHPSGWKAGPAPVIAGPTFHGGGTRLLEPAGRDAIDALFERTLG